MRIIYALFVAFSALLLPVCSKACTITPFSRSICVGDTLNLSSSDTGGTWSITSGASFATLSVSGTTAVVHSTAPGSVTVHYTIGSSVGIAFVDIYGPPVVPPVTGAASVCAHGGDTLFDASGGGTWASSNPSVAFIDAHSGIIYPASAGSVTMSYTITASCGSTTVTYPFSVDSAGIQPITGAVSFCIGATDSLSDVSWPGTWSSSDTLVATIDALTGVVYGGNAGTANITYTVANTCGTYHATVPVTVTGPLTSFPILGHDSVVFGGSTALTDSASGGSWSSSNPTVATVDTVTGVVYGLFPGTAVISYVISNVCGSVVVTKTVRVVMVEGMVVSLSEHPIGLYPNPARNKLNISCPTYAGENVSVHIRDLAGAIAYSQKLDPSPTGLITLSIKDLPNGTYLLEIASENSRSVQLLIKE